jgi:hypothetical protein
VQLIHLGFKEEEVLDPVQVKRRRFQIQALGIPQTSQAPRQSYKGRYNHRTLRVVLMQWLHDHLFIVFLEKRNLKVVNKRQLKTCPICGGQNKQMTRHVKVTF